MSLIKYLFASTLVMSSLCQGQSRLARVTSSGESRVVSGAGKSQVEFIFHTFAVENPPVDGSHRRFIQCTQSKTPCSLTEEIRVTISGQEVPLPRSAFADLGDISEAELITNNHRVVLTIRGGDASESYIAKLSFRNGRLVKRRIFSGEDSSHQLEITRYY